MVIGYAQPGKARSFQVLEAFTAGCGGRVAQRPVLEDGDVAFYGTLGLEWMVRQVRAEGRTFYFGDNSFFDAGRGRFFRFARDAFQVHEKMPPDHGRLAALGVKIRPWAAGGRHIVVVEQSEHFLELSGIGKHWLVRVLADMRRYTDRPLVVRRWRRDKAKAASTLAADLRGAWALVTHMSAAANEALIAGVPAFVSGLCAATPMASGELSKIESPNRPDGREDWAAGLAGAQWTLGELRDGTAWRGLNDHQPG